MSRNSSAAPPRPRSFSRPAEPKLLLHVGKQHLDLFAQAVRMLEGLGILQRDHLLADCIIERYGDGALCAARALLADGTYFAIARRGPVGVNASRRRCRAVFEKLALPTDEVVLFEIKGECLARQQAARLLLAI